MVPCELHKGKNNSFLENSPKKYGFVVPFAKFALANLFPSLFPMISKATKKPFPSLLHWEIINHCLCQFGDS
jgi:hypothetical protein